MKSKKLVSLLLALIMVLSMAPLSALAEASRPTLTIFDFTEELNQELINNATTIQYLEDRLNVNLEIEVISGMSTEEKIATMIASGDYAKVLNRWGEGVESIPQSEINPPGLGD